MGHYDDIYDEEDRIRLEEYNRLRAIKDAERKAKLCRMINGFDRDDAEFTEEIMDNLDSYRGFFAILDRSRK